MNHPLAVITVTYSPGEYLERFLDSLSRATIRDVIVVMADNGSVDGAPEKAAQQHDNVFLLPTGGNLGYGTAINIAARALRRGDYGDIDTEHLLISNPDVVFGPGSIDELLDCSSRHDSAACVGPLIVEPDGSIYPSARAVPTLRNGIGHALFGSIWPSNPWTAAYKDDADMATERKAGWLSGSCLLVRWDPFLSIGGFDERYFMYLEDVDLGDRFGRAGWDNILCPTATITHAKGHSTESVPEAMLPAHHDSAFRFQADRHAGAFYAPLRAALWLGLKTRAALAVACAKKGKSHC
ncbi:glycosyltransferase family 2 protein [Corynebacterium aquilae]|uniref:Alpha-D-GlcNAc-diphosphoryl polyprenol, alpha-3-L-rhamnosyl transferase n=1 Tax=Corynebacterium aquilae DSM 44791 TaxID=1431546 RepID=A0A1L7CE88_9CORY|nr:glycosyltransferase family 2 protein [Corynebacterium aquilae]APT84182.1 alpha-D-GlcNAc-diphosphoryl polyprenol, alpha-3-L-rhamnosyl transferase [Corynebacterium aquilae DSM 44791]